MTVKSIQTLSMCFSISNTNWFSFQNGWKLYKCKYSIKDKKINTFITHDTEISSSDDDSENDCE